MGRLCHWFFYFIFCWALRHDHIQGYGPRKKQSNCRGFIGQHSSGATHAEQNSRYRNGCTFTIAWLGFDLNARITVFTANRISRYF